MPGSAFASALGATAVCVCGGGGVPCLVLTGVRCACLPEPEPVHASAPLNGLHLVEGSPDAEQYAEKGAIESAPSHLQPPKQEASLAAVSAPDLRQLCPSNVDEMALDEEPQQQSGA